MESIRGTATPDQINLYRINGTGGFLRSWVRRFQACLGRCAKQVPCLSLTTSQLISLLVILLCSISWPANAASPVSGLSLIFPVSGFTEKILQDYGEFDDGSANRHHAGIDIPAAVGTPVFAAEAGIARVITLAGNGNRTHCMGNVVIIKHGSASTLYAHLQDNSIIPANGSPVIRGQTIASVGRTIGDLAAGAGSGSSTAGTCGSTGAHLHFELKNNPYHGTKYDGNGSIILATINDTWGYTPGPVGTIGSMVASDHPDAWGFHDPILNIASGVVTLSPSITVETKPLPPGFNQLNLRVGSDTAYRIVKGISVARTQFTATKQSGATTGCSQGWYQLTQLPNTNPPYFLDAITNSSKVVGGTAYVPDVWACIGDGASTFIGPMAGAVTTYSITASIISTGSGSVVSAPSTASAGGINCSAGSCSALYNSGASVTLIATPASGSIFAGWAGGGCTGAGRTCTVIMNANQSVSATFTANPAPVILVVNSTNPPNGVLITVSPADKNGASNGVTLFTRTYNSSTAVTLTASATAGAKNFSNWTGCTSTIGRICHVTMTAAKTVTANYTTPTPSVILVVNSTNPPNGVLITVSPADKNGQGVGSSPFARIYNSGAQVMLTAPATSGAKNFSNWTGCTSTIGRICNVAMTATKTVTANYMQQNQTGAVKVTISPQGAINAGAQWRVDATPWQNSGVTIVGLVVGQQHVVSFKPIANWLTPGNQNVNIVANQTSTTSGVYTPQFPTDTTPPVITLIGNAVVTVTQGQNYVDAGVTAMDNVDGNLTGSIVPNNPVNTSVIGSYTVTYNVMDAAGNAAAQVSRTVNVVVATDTTPPVISLRGPAMITVVQGSAYNDAGATAFDNRDGDITAGIVPVNSVNTAVIGNYTVTYDVTDASGNAATQVIRTVYVIAQGGATLPNSAAQISLTGSAASAEIYSAGQSISNFSAAGATGAPLAGVSVPFGVLSYTTTVPVGAISQTVDITFSTALPANYVLYKVDNAGVYSLIPNGAGTDRWTQVDAMTIALMLSDGGQFDLDGMINGVIIDPVAVGVPPAAPPAVPAAAPTAAGGGGGGCSINADALFDPAMLALLLFSMLSLTRKRRRDKCLKIRN